MRAFHFSNTSTGKECMEDVAMVLPDGSLNRKSFFQSMPLLALI
ncbi:MAG: hypothetical protein WCG87_00750 [Bacteroidota bacterium]